MILPDLHWTKLFGMPSWAWAAIIAPIVTGVMARAAFMPAKQRDGTAWLTPSIGMYLLLPVAFIMLLMFGVTFIATSVLIFQEPEKSLIWLLWLGSPFMVFAGASLIWSILLVRIGFNSDGIIRSIANRRLIIAWADVAEIKRHWALGPRIVLTNGRQFSVSEYLGGFRDLTAAAQFYGVPVRI